ncbi:hypothetical protein N8I77_013333 [Diaporthe amygdali]|uniref:Uncharacterized protein n=1 Tax=Phomopsis amygdali TaxID=1214568 RepID=A0AAD9S2A5_PHOAM|nr:hypothetical protein N8I77_013333 [Diaporthe amygdali]
MLRRTHAHTMDTDGSQCPENSNSTDCLLRALLQLLKEYREADNAEIDWDPINFAFTVLIGLIAILFALATILQAIFAAGKGRRRTNRLAIGKWSQKTTRKWDWSEMNFRFTASTPILREESLPAMPERSKTTFHVNDDEVDDEPADKDQSNHEKGHPSASAAWLEIFEEVGLHKLGVQAWASSTREVPADYLPDDLMAAPAYAQVGAVVAAAVTAGVQKLDVDQQNYPILLGRGFQIDFRQHPSLGVIGAYSRYDKGNKKARTLSLEQLRSAMQYGRGIIDADMMTMDLSTKAKRRQVIERWRWNQNTNSMLKRPSDIFLLELDAISEIHLPLISSP